MVKQYFIVTFFVQTRKKTISHVSLWPCEKCVPPTNSKEKVKVVIDALLPFSFPFAHSVLSPCSDQKWGCTKILTFKAPLGFWSVVSQYPTIFLPLSLRLNHQQGGSEETSPSGLGPWPYSCLSSVHEGTKLIDFPPLLYCQTNGLSMLPPEREALL